MAYDWSQTDVEGEIRRFVKLLEEHTDDLPHAARTSGLAASRYKKAHAGALLTAKGKTVADREAIADLECHEEYEAHKIADALWSAKQEAARNLRAQLSALQTISANIRGQI
jgi:hypothetical protein